MNRSQRFITCVSVLLVVAALALDRTSHAGDEWQPILPADLALKDNPASFFNSVKTSDDNQIVLQNAESAQK